MTPAHALHGTIQTEIVLSSPAVRTSRFRFHNISDHPIVLPVPFPGIHRQFRLPAEPFPAARERTADTSGYKVRSAHLPRRSLHAAVATSGMTKTPGLNVRW